jgi:Cytochrome c.
MNRKSAYIIFLAILNYCFLGCNSNEQKSTDNIQPSATKTDTPVSSKTTNPKGIGKFSDIKLTHPLDKDMVGKGLAIYQAKCFACHKLTDEKLVGPGWKGVTNRRTPEWIMNFTTNTQVMLDQDAVAQQEMVTCLVRMPNQDLKDEQARQILEFMRNNDGKN